MTTSPTIPDLPDPEHTLQELRRLRVYAPPSPDLDALEAQVVAQLPAEDDLYRAYVVPHEAWYSQHLPERDGPSISVELASREGGCAWEFEITGEGDLGVRIKMFSDAWRAFTDVPELFPALAALGPSATLADVRRLLDRQGWEDITRRTPPGVAGDAPGPQKGD
jgi:hypothetical protein